VSFDRLAVIYQALETLSFGGRLQACRIAGLSWIEAPRKALLLGEGNGRFLQGLLDRFPESHIHVMDASPAMLSQARQRVERHQPEDLDRVHFEEARLPDTPLEPGAYDLLVTNFFLDCFDGEGLARLLPDLGRCLTSHGLWLHADFHQPETGWRRLRARIWLAVMYRFFALTTDLEARRLQDPHPMLRDMGWECLRSARMDQDFLQASLWRRRQEPAILSEAATGHPRD